MTWLSIMITAALATTNGARDPGRIATQVARTARTHLGAQYIYGDTGTDGFDCSGLVQSVFKAHGYALPRTSREQVLVGTPVSMDDVAPGDLLFFTHSPGSSRITHVGIALDNGRMVHASRGHQHVVISRYTTQYFKKRWFAARRLLSTAPIYQYDAVDADVRDWGHPGLLCDARTSAVTPALQSQP